MKHLMGLTLLAAMFATHAMAVESDAGNMASNMEKHGHKHWEEMDANKDGSITKDEFTAAHAKRFDEMDANKDGKVTKDEMKAFHKERRADRMQRRNAKQ